MSIETGLYSRLTTDTDVSGVISTRAYPLRLPQGYTLPALSYQRISTDRVHELDGVTGRAVARFQVDCWAETYQAVRDLANKVRLALDGHSGTLGSETGIGNIHLVSDRDLFEEDVEIYRATLDFQIQYTEATS